MKYLKFIPITKTFNISANHRKLIVDKPDGSLNSHSITLHCITNPELQIPSPTSCRGRQSWQGGERQRKRHFAPRASFFVLYIWNLQDAELILEAFPEAVKERLSHIPRHQYDKNAKIGLNTNHPDWKDHGHGLIMYKHRIYIPPNPSLHEDIIRLHHDSIAAGHPGRYKTLELITREYWWPHLQANVRQYVDGCEAANKLEFIETKPHAPLNPHEIPSHPWEHISVDIIGPLPELDGYNTILGHCWSIFQNDHPCRNTRYPQRNRNR